MIHQSLLKLSHLVALLVVLISLATKTVKAEVEVEHEVLITVSSQFPFYYNLSDLRYLEVEAFLPLFEGEETESSASMSNISEHTRVCCKLEQKNATDPLGIWTELSVIFCRDLESEEYDMFRELSPNKLPGFCSRQLCHHRLVFNGTNYVPIVFKSIINKDGTIGTAQAWLALVILIITYVFVGTEVVHRTLVACLAAFVTFIFLVCMAKHPYISTVETWIDPTTIILLFAMMILIAIFSLTGVFEWLAVKCYQLSRGNIRALAAIMWLLAAGLSAFLPNITCILLMSPVTFRICEILDQDPVPFVLGEAIMSNIGGVATLIGDPPNIIIGKELNLSFVSFIANLAPCVVLACGPVMAFFYWYYRKELCGTKKLDVKELLREYKIKDMKLLIYCCIDMGTVLILFFLQTIIGLDPAYAAIFGAIVLMVLCDRKKIDETLHKVEWETLILFAALFVLIEGLNRLGMIRLFAKALSAIISSAPQKGQLALAVLLFIWVSAIASAFVDNVPWTITMVSVVREISRDLLLPQSTLAWALAYGACFGGNGTIIGASANVVAADLCKSKGHPVSFLDWVKIGAPATVISVAISTVYMMIIYVAGGYVW